MLDEEYRPIGGLLCDRCGGSGTVGSEACDPCAGRGRVPGEPMPPRHPMRLQALEYAFALYADEQEQVRAAAGGEA